MSRRAAARDVLRVAVDGTPLLGTRTGVGRYVGSLLEALPAVAGPSLDLRLTAFTWRTGDKPEVAGARWRHVPAPARLLRAAWTRTGFPPAELLGGRADVFHATNFVLPPLRRAAGVVTVHDLTFLRYPETVSAASLAYRALVPDAVCRAARVVTPSQAVADEVVAEFSVAPERVVVTPLGVSPRWYEAVAPSADDRRRLGLPERYLLFVGTREPRKDLATLVAAHRAARDHDADAVPALVVAGPAGWGDADVAGRDVVLAGWLAEPDLARVVAGAVAVVLPSLYEGFGLPVLEALACGRPVVASDLPALREVGGDLCRYVPPRDRDALAEALVDAGRSGHDAGDEQRRRRRAAGFTWARCAERTLEAYRAAAAECQTRATTL